MNRWLNKANQRLSLTSAAALLMGAGLVGQILGFMRTQVINGSFNSINHIQTDPYFAAFKIPDFFFYTITAGALGVAFMPFVADRLAKSDKEGIWRLTSSVLNCMLILMAAVGALLFIFPQFFLNFVIHNNLGAHETEQAITITRLIALNPLLFATAGVLTSLQQTFGRFFFYAMSPIIYNGAIILSVYIFRDNIGLVGLGIGALAGAVLSLAFVLLGLIGSGFRYHPKIYWKMPDFRQILRNLPPRSIDQGIDSINSIVETNRASTLKSGSISIYENAYTLHLAPILLIGTTISTAAFPRLNERLAQGRPDLFKRDFLKIFRVMLWIILPMAVVTYFTRGYLARLIFKSTAPVDIAQVLGLLAVAIIFRTMYSIISRYFYANKDTRTPLYVSLIAIAVNVVLAFSLVKTYGIIGLPIAQSVVAAVEVGLLMIVMAWRDRGLFNKEFWKAMLRIVSVTGFTMLATYLASSIVTLSITDKGFIKLGAEFLAIVIPALVTHIVVSSLFGLEEVQPVIARLKKLVFKPVRVQ